MGKARTGLGITLRDRDEIRDAMRQVRDVDWTGLRTEGEGIDWGTSYYRDTIYMVATPWREQ